MPTVGSKEFPYSAAGKKAAGAYAAKTGKPMVEKPMPMKRAAKPKMKPKGKM